MKIWKISLTLLALTALVAASVLVAGDKMEAKKAETKQDTKGKMATQVGIDKPAPDFTLMSVDGQKHSLADFKGKTVVLEWVNFDCPFVKKHYHSGNMQKLQKAYAKKGGVVWLSICSSAPGKQGYFAGDDLKDRINAEEWTATAYLIDSDGEVGRRYGAKTTPHMYVIDPEGVLRYAGAIDNVPSTKAEDVKDAANFVSSALDNLIAKKAVEIKTSTPYGCSVKYGGKAKAEASKTL